MPIAIAIAAISSLLGISIFAFTDAGEHIAQPASEFKEGIRGLTLLIALLMVFWVWRSRS